MIGLTNMLHPNYIILKGQLKKYYGLKAGSNPITVIRPFCTNWPMGFTLQFIVIIKKNLLHNGNTITNPITKMGVVYVFESNFFPQKSLKAGEHPVKKLALYQGVPFFQGP